MSYRLYVNQVNMKYCRVEISTQDSLANPGINVSLMLSKVLLNFLYVEKGEGGFAIKDNSLNHHRLSCFSRTKYAALFRGHANSNSRHQGQTSFTFFIAE